MWDTSVFRWSEERNSEVVFAKVHGHCEEEVPKPTVGKLSSPTDSVAGDAIWRILVACERSFRVRGKEKKSLQAPLWRKILIRWDLYVGMVTLSN